MKDKHGNDIVYGRPYTLIYGMPGPDTTLVIAVADAGGKVNCYDLIFNFEREIDSTELFQPYKFKWDNYEINLVKKYGGDWKFMIDHNKKLDEETADNPLNPHIIAFSQYGKPEKPLTKYKAGGVLTCTFSMLDDEYSVGQSYTIAALDDNGWPRITNRRGKVPDIGIDPMTCRIWTFQPE